MNSLAKKMLDQGLALNQRMSHATANGVEWVFKRDTLIKSGRTWHELVHDSDLMTVRYYDLPDDDEIELVDGSRIPIKRDRYPVPLVLVPPLAVTTETFDLMPQRSLVRFMVAAGFEVYLIDWGKPQKEHASLDLSDYTYTMFGTALDKIRRHAGKQDVSVMGWCMGGLMTLLYQGQVLDKNIRNIVAVASPIDMETGKGVVGAVAGVAQALDGPAQLVSNYTNLRLNTLDPARLSMPDWATTLVFKMTDPVSAVTTYWDLVTRLWDREFVESHSTTSDYLNNMLRYPGGVVKDFAGGVLTENQLAKGRVTVGDRVAELGKIKSNLLAFAGKTDALVPPDVAAKIVDVVSSQDAEFRIAPGGHMGVIIGGKAQSAVWAESAQWLAERSGEVDKVPAKPKRKSKAKAKTKAKAKAIPKSGSRPKTKTKVKPKTRAQTKTKAKRSTR